MLAEALTKGERLFLTRRRACKKLAEAAEFFQISIPRYTAWEADRRTDVPDIYLDGITPAEHYRIIRRRSGLTATEVCRRAGFSREWLNKMERGLRPLKRLVQFWGG